MVYDLWKKEVMSIRGRYVKAGSGGLKGEEDDNSWIGCYNIL